MGDFVQNFLLKIISGIVLFSASLEAQEIPEGFVYIDEVIPDIVYDIRYAGAHNFVGKPINGYENAQAILSKPAANALAKVQKELIQKDFMLKVFDAYRPQRAVNHFMEWARDSDDTIMKQEFYPEIAKKDLFQLGYIATKSGHSRGSTVDLTMINVSDCENVDMGGTYDFFGEISHHNTTQISEQQKKNREILRLIMRKYGFRSYSEEWWHYTYDMEPYPATYFDFPVK
ncbi:M15 family metallopeptidase [Gramella sp. MAR_2010_147]|uniref:M15 family metallopeptidase n=1 Tax=Gramella sp. MAR_2010_147 TaxID=1250205 RepID=UPI0008792E6C|nr:M15 family metallopeptidase [Gramella sp. MAR_2010_147]SDR98365.1 D-Ala-D-Ala dipeptidase vanX. Metallo peptidase. MEROPS family M15D [Gramella sp. MAR_2010_147]